MGTDSEREREEREDEEVAGLFLDSCHDDFCTSFLQWVCFAQDCGDSSGIPIASTTADPGETSSSTELHGSSTSDSIWAGHYLLMLRSAADNSPPGRGKGWVRP
ncbi:hypothetical protein U14_02858 [Candidatus Moduliflexus flocculans]|uniref:Uncharacterized protein n=1 Tax=Candidatus Moduliflexus flocculans TaxID=1499966 RepID=A0A081BMJ7_9BACT|nr:hypothetical protein U14_02858 [Candidatus Moduliflexus flocculans]